MGKILLWRGCSWKSCNTDGGSAERMLAMALLSIDAGNGMPGVDTPEEKWGCFVNGSS